MHILICSIGENLYGLNLDLVERTFRAVEITPFQIEKDAFVGVINIHGEIVPILDMRKQLRLQQKQVEMKDHFILCHHQGKKMVLWVDTISQVKWFDKQQMVEIEKKDANGKVNSFLKDGEKLIHYFNLAEVL